MIDVAEVEDALRVWVVATAGYVRHENTTYSTEDGGTDVALRWFDLERVEDWAAQVRSNSQLAFQSQT